MIKFFILFIVSIYCINLANSKEKLVAELFESEINIDVGFTGATISIFGVIDEEGDVVVTVTCPRKNIVVRKKESVMGIWINGSAKYFSDVPSFYYLASNRPLEELNAETSLHINQIGLNNLRFEGAEEDEINDRRLWKNGIIKTMLKQGRYSDEIGKINISKNKLFKTELYFGSDIIEGEYIVDTLLFKSGNVVGARRSFINVSKSGLGAKIHSLASYNSLLYGFFAVILALLFGFLANLIVRK